MRGRSTFSLIVLAAWTAVALAHPVQASFQPDTAYAQWDDSTIRYASGNYLQPCDPNSAGTCIEAASLSRRGQTVQGLPLLDTRSGWIYSFEIAGSVETFWFAMTQGRDRDPYVSLYIVPIQERPMEAGSSLDDACYRGWSAATMWCVTTLDADQRFSVTLRSPLRSSGWMDARMGEPSVTVIAPTSAQPGRLTVSGSPIRIPTLKLEFSRNNAQQREEWNTLVETAVGRNGDQEAIIPPSWDSCQSERIFCWAPFPALAPYTYNNLSKALPGLLSRATGWATVWRVHTALVSDEFRPDSECLGAFNGLTSSNAMAYQQYVRYDSFTRQVTFVMAGPTWNADGKRLTGDFSLVMTETAAQCQWGTFNIGDQFIIEVTTEEGVEAVGTATVTRRDGQIVVRAVGFGFSLKQAALTQVKRGAPAKPKNVKAVVRNSALKVTWTQRPAIKYRLRVTTGEGNLQRTLRVVDATRGAATFSGLARGTYAVQVVATNARGQSLPAMTSATVR